MELSWIRFDALATAPELSRNASSKVFEDRLRSSIAEIGLSEPIKVARTSIDQFLVVDGNLRVRAIERIRETHPSAFERVPAYIVDFDSRFEVRFQSDVYQDLLPSQVAAFVEHLHASAGIRKADIAKYIGVSPATVRNYTGLWRLVQRGGLFAGVVELMDTGVVPSSNPYAWLRLTEEGLENVLRREFAEGVEPARWIRESVDSSRTSPIERFSIKYVEEATGALEPAHYREAPDVRTLKQSLGLRRADQKDRRARAVAIARSRLDEVLESTNSPVLRSAARTLLGVVA